jgi:hypothetical protein
MQGSFVLSSPSNPHTELLQLADSFKQTGPGGKDSGAHCSLSNKHAHSHTKVGNLWFNPSTD